LGLVRHNILYSMTLYYLLPLLWADKAQVNPLYIIDSPEKRSLPFLQRKNNCYNKIILKLYEELKDYVSRK
jgi:hypothetical protein